MSQTRYYTPFTFDQPSGTYGTSSTTASVMNFLPCIVNSAPYTDILVQLSVTFGSATVTATRNPVYFYIFGGLDPNNVGTTGLWSTSSFLTSTTGAVSLACPVLTTYEQAVPILATVPAITPSITVTTSPISLASFFGGFIPPYLTIGYINATGNNVTIVHGLAVGVTY